MKKQITLELTEEELNALMDAIRNSNDFYKETVRDVYDELYQYALDFTIEDDE